MLVCFFRFPMSLFLFHSWCSESEFLFGVESFCIVQRLDGEYGTIRLPKYSEINELATQWGAKSYVSVVVKNFGINFPYVTFCMPETVSNALIE